VGWDEGRKKVFYHINYRAARQPNVIEDDLSRCWVSLETGKAKVGFYFAQPNLRKTKYSTDITNETLKVKSLTKILRKRHPDDHLDK
jgi:hypothetical protein